MKTANGKRILKTKSKQKDECIKDLFVLAKEYEEAVILSNNLDSDKYYHHLRSQIQFYRNRLASLQQEINDITFLESFIE